MQNAAIIVAAGRGLRASEGGERPKQYRAVGGVPVIRRSLIAFLDHDDIALVLPVIHAEDQGLYNEATAGLFSPKLLPPVAGGSTRQASVLAGLTALGDAAPDRVLIHDAARPFVPGDAITRVLAGLAEAPACLAALRLSDTLKKEAGGRVHGTVSRDGLWRAQTPQGFHYAAILAAHQRAAAESGPVFTDDAAIAEWQEIPVALALGSERNMKLTTAEDFALAEQMLRGDAPMVETRTGTGFDVHAFEPGGDQVTLCGVTIPHAAALIGHSDADVGLHALTDALLGTIAAGDIGLHFPPTDPKWRGADSALFSRTRSACSSKPPRASSMSM